MSLTATEARGSVRWAYLGMFLIALVTIALELLFTRVVSVIAFYHLSFFVISLAILGMTVGALLVYVHPEHFQPATALPRYSRWFAVSLPLTLGAVFAVPIPPATSLSGVLALALMALLVSVPFLCSGIVVSLTLTRCGLPYGRIYAADLLGAGLGAIIYLIGLDTFKPGALVFLLAALVAAAGAAYQRFARQGAREFALWGALFAGLAVYDQAFTSGLILLQAKDEFVYKQKDWYEGWNHHARIAVGMPARRMAWLWGPSPLAPQRDVEEAYLTIDAGAGTHLNRFNGDLATMRWLNDDVTALAYQLQPPGRVAIIGIGGGRDALSALVGGANHVVGIDVNALILNLLNGKSRPDVSEFVGLNGRPDVTLAHDDARSYLATSKERFDVIQMSLIDTWAASAAGAYTMTENGLYTEEAWRTFLDALSDRGLFTVSRWYHRSGLDDTSRMIALGIAACQAQGLTPVERHLVLANAGDIATLIISKAPLSDAARKQLAAVAEAKQFQLLIQPGKEPVLPLHRRLMACATRRELDEACADHLLNITPPTDDSPYFFNQLRLSRAWEFYYGEGRTVAVGMGNLQATLTLLVALAIAVAGLAVGIAWPLRRVPFPAHVPVGTVRLCLLYFIAIGLGFMLVEMALVQRFSVLLGHPSYALAVVLSSMILATGVGSLVADRLPADQPATFVVFPIVILVVLFAAWWALPRVFAATVQESLALRIGATLSLTVPCGLVMGLCFPLGMVQSARLAESLAPWLWGINGAAGVIGTILAVFLSMSLGIAATFLVGIGCYAVVALVNCSLRGLLTAQPESAAAPSAPVDAPALDPAIPLA